MELVRLTRDVSSLEQVLILLTAQYENARLEESRDVRTVQVLDSAALPERESRPRRGFMMAGAFALTLVLGAGYAIFRGREPEPPIMRAVRSL